MRATSIVLLFLLMFPAALCAQGDAVKAVEVIRCPKCGQSKQTHRLCANCGYVNKSLSLVVSDAQE